LNICRLGNLLSRQCFDATVAEPEFFKGAHARES
jgi:hypothetical protein